MAQVAGTQINPLDPETWGGGFLDDVDGAILESAYVLQPPRDGGSGKTHCALRWLVQPTIPGAGPVEVHYRVGENVDFIPTPDGQAIQSLSGKAVWDRMGIAFLGIKLQNLGIAADDLAPASAMVGRAFHFESLPSGGTKTDGTPYTESVPTAIVGELTGVASTASANDDSKSACKIVNRLLSLVGAPIPFAELMPKLATPPGGVPGPLVGHPRSAEIGRMLCVPYDGGFWATHAGTGKGFQIVDGALVAEA